MRIFIKLRQFVLDNEELRQEVTALREQTEERFQIVFETLDRLLATNEQPNIKIGFIDVDD